MQCTAAAKGHKGKIFRVKSPFDAHEPNGASHTAVCNFQDGFGGVHCCEAQWVANMFVNCAARGLYIQALKLPTNWVIRVNPSQENIGVCHRRSCVAKAIGHWSRVAPGALWTDIEQAALVHPSDRSAARADRGYLNHRIAHDHSKIN